VRLLLDIDLYENAPYGAYPIGILNILNKEIPLVEFDYRETEEDEIITTICPQLALLPGMPVGVDQVKQIIITKINGETIQ
jgi:hypothetical protein